MPILMFPDNDPRANAGLLLKRRPWLRQGATGKVVVGGKGRSYRYTTAVQFVGAPKGNYDLVSPELLKSRKVIPRKARGD